MDTAQLTLVRQPFDHPDFLFELKHDGCRALAHIWDGKCELISRKRNAYKNFQALRDNLSKLKVKNAVIDFNIENVRKFRESWPNKNFAARKKLEATRAFFRFCNVSGWISTNPAAALKPGKTTDPQIPITKPEFDKILKACNSYPNKRNAVRLRAVVLVMRYTGLRIRDVVTLRKDSIQNGRVFLRAAKTGTDVFCPLPPSVIAALEDHRSQRRAFLLDRRFKAEVRSRRLSTGLASPF
jgi:integrase